MEEDGYFVFCLMFENPKKMLRGVGKYIWIFGCCLRNATRNASGCFSLHLFTSFQFQFRLYSELDFRFAVQKLNFP